MGEGRIPELRTPEKFTDVSCFSGAVLNNFNQLTGGGGGNRTRVRKSSAQGVYMLISSFCVSSEEAPSKQGSFQTNPLVVSPCPPTGHGNSAILLIVASSAPTGERQRDASLTRLECTRNYWRVYLLYRRFNESPECSTCNLDLNYPRRNQCAPFRLSG